jgi:isopenicillin N synthase-like dioxygenase
VIDVSTLRTAPVGDGFCSHVHSTSSEIYNAAVNVGFFYISNHGVPESLLTDLDDISKEFFAKPVAEKKLIDMANGGKAWRGYFAVGDEVTSGIPDQKEGLYFGTELSSNDEDSRPLHGVSQWPAGEPGQKMRHTVLTYMSEMKTLGQLLMRAVSCSLNVTDASFTSQFENPTELFRIFNYPPHNPVFGERALGVGEHTDYGYLTLLKQDSNGGLQVKDTRANVWMDADPIPGTFVVNLGDALEHATWGLFKATPHRVQQRINTQSHRLSMPYFFDPCFDCEMRHVIPEEVARAGTEARAAATAAVEITASSEATEVPVPTSTAEAAQEAPVAAAQGLYTRWDGADPTMFTGTYGSYLLRKVSRAFPALFAQHITAAP